jgi:acyl carrier protein phosphodiesterase
MNHLAHFYLAFEDPDMLVGQFIADSVKGNQWKNFHGGVQKGILVHRFIDHFTDQHPLCRNLRAMLRPQLGLLSPIALDVFLDHVLAKNWNLYHHDPLPDFAQSCYDVLQLKTNELPDKMSTVLHHMSKHNWLVMYSELSGLERIMLGMSQRVKAGERLATSTQMLHNQLETINSSFLEYFPELIDACKVKINTFATDLI